MSVTAWYAELKRINWYCINGFNAVKWYSEKLLLEWWDSLSQEEKDELERRRLARKEREREETERKLKSLIRIYGSMLDAYERSMLR